MVYIDPSKAFESLYCGILLDQLEHNGTGGVPLKLSESYITNRLQTVYRNGFFLRQKR